jgi:ribosomal protein S2
MNDDATKALEYVFGLMQDALLDGKKKTAKSEGMKQI